ncbi:hypothetical protein VTI74DRAFT_5850 [Chaetomium olivicolor]
MRSDILWIARHGRTIAQASSETPASSNSNAVDTVRRVAILTARTAAACLVYAGAQLPAVQCCNPIRASALFSSANIQAVSSAATLAKLLQSINNVKTAQVQPRHYDGVISTLSAVPIPHITPQWTLIADAIPAPGAKAECGLHCNIAATH